MNGYDWDTLVRFYVANTDPDLMNEVETDPEAGMFSTYMAHSPENLEKMKRFESHIRTMLAGESTLMEFIEANSDEVEWD